MTKKTQRLHQFAKLPLALAVAASMSTPASAFQFYMGEMEANLDTFISAGASWRLEDPDEYLYGVGNGGKGGSINSDDGTLNFEKNSTYSKIIKGNSDFLVTYGDWGAFARARYWYDFELKDEGRATDVNGYTRELSKAGKANASGGEVMDAYIWKDFWFGEMPLNVRLGKQVVSWGESTFIFNGINVINPVDIGVIRAPGAQIKEALIPVNMLYGSLGLTDDITIEAFIQLEYEKTRIDDCGTFFSSNDYVADECGPVYVLNALSEQTNREGLGGDPTLPTRLTRGGDIEPDDTDQFGIAVRWFAQELNETEFGFYFLQYHSRAPLVSGVVATDLPAFDADGNVTAPPDGEISTPEIVLTGGYQVEYPEKIQMGGISFNTTGPGGISLGGEYSFKHNVPVQLNSPDLVAGAAGKASSIVFQNRVPDENDDGVIDMSDAVAAGFLGSFQKGYDLFDVSQLQFTAIKFIDQFMGASRMIFVGEVGGTYVHDLPDESDIRYGRYDQLSFGVTPDFDILDDEGDPLTADEVCLNNNSIGTCDVGGYVTDFSWGYRFRTSWVYNDVFAGVNLTPQIAWSQDVDGYAPGPGANFIEGRKTIGLSVKADYLNQYSMNLAYTNYFDGGKHNAVKDRDNVALSVAYSF